MKFSIITPTHNPKFLAQTWESVRSQTYDDWEWVICVNDKNGDHAQIRRLVDEVSMIIGGAHVGNAPKVFIVSDIKPSDSIGQRKKFAFDMGTGDVLVELDHDDLLLPNALELLAKEFSDPEIGFVYSDCADFEDGAKTPQGEPPTYVHADSRPSWVNNGFEFYERELGGVRPGKYLCVKSFAPSAMALSTIFWAPNHVRAWRKSVYEKIGGHDPSFPIADDHELLTRTYCLTKMRHIPEPLYLYRFGANTFTGKAAEIRERTFMLQRERLEALVLRECKLRGGLAFDLGGVHGTPVITDLNLAQWCPVDSDPRVLEKGGIQCDLRQRFPWADSSVFAIRAHDFLEHLPDKMHTMSEIYRVLVPGGWLLSNTPSTDGRGAWQDPFHVSFWNSNAFWYWTRAQQQQYLPQGQHPKFQEAVLDNWFPSDWHKLHNIVYTRADLVSLKDGYRGPGERFI